MVGEQSCMWASSPRVLCCCPAPCPATQRRHHALYCAGHVLYSQALQVPGLLEPWPAPVLPTLQPQPLPQTPWGRPGGTWGWPSAAIPVATKSWLEWVGLTHPFAAGQNPYCVPLQGLRFASHGTTPAIASVGRVLEDSLDDLSSCHAQRYDEASMFIEIPKHPLIKHLWQRPMANAFGHLAMNYRSHQYQIHSGSFTLHQFSRGRLEHHFTSGFTFDGGPCNWNCRLCCARIQIELSPFHCTQIIFPVVESAIEFKGSDFLFILCWISSSSRPAAPFFPFPLRPLFLEGFSFKLFYPSDSLSS